MSSSADYLRGRLKLLYHLRLLPMSLCALPCLAFLLGCGSINPPSRAPSGRTSVTVVAKSTANGQLTRFEMDIRSLQLRGAANGDTANLIDTPLHVEFLQVNGTGEPIVTASVPEGTYTSATASVGPASFLCIALGQSGELTRNDFAYGHTPDSQVTVNLPTPINISGANMTLSLELLVSKSASWTSCHPNGLEPFSIAPAFDLTKLDFVAEPSNDQNGLLTDLKGIVSSFDASSGRLTINAIEGPDCSGTTMGANCSPPAASAPIWQVVSDYRTVFDGVPGITALATGTAVDLDGALQPDGSLLAKRIAVYDGITTNQTIAEGPLLSVTTIEGYQNLEMEPVRELGPLRLGPIPLSYDGATFQISSRFRNLSELPFSPKFNAASAVDGQHIYASTQALFPSLAPIYVPATTITLIPQTINGAVRTIGVSGSFTTYAVELAPYDLFPQLAVQPGRGVALTNPNTVIVYSDGNTQMLNTSPIETGSVVRFYGLVFNDNGTLRMDCAQIMDGVPE